MWHEIVRTSLQAIPLSNFDYRHMCIKKGKRYQIRKLRMIFCLFFATPFEDFISPLFSKNEENSKLLVMNLRVSTNHKLDFILIK